MRRRQAFSSSLSGAFAQALFATALCALLLVGAGWSVKAQSGRHVPKGSPPPVVVPEAAPAEKKPPAKPSVPQIPVVVGMDKTASGFSYLPYNFYNDVLEGCASRLTGSSAVKVSVESDQMSRGAAIKRAKSQKEAYVVWLQLEVRNTSMTSQQDTQLDDLIIRYTVFTPETAKIKTDGQVYPSAYSSRGVLSRRPTGGSSNPYYIEDLLKLAAAKAADRILDSLNLPPPSDSTPIPRQPLRKAESSGQ